MSRLEDLAKRREAKAARMEQIKADKATRELKRREDQNRKKQERDRYIDTKSSEIQEDMSTRMGGLISQARRIIGGRVESSYGEARDGRVYIRKEVIREEGEVGYGDATGPSYTTTRIGVDVTQYEDGTVEIKGSETWRLRGRRAKSARALDKALVKAVKRPYKRPV